MSTERATRAQRITLDAQREILSLDVRGISEAEIARRVNVSRGAVRRTLERGRPLVAVTQDLRAERSRALAVLLEVQHVAWEGVESAMARGRNIAPLLAEIRLSQVEINRLLALIDPDVADPLEALEELRATVLRIILAEIPEAAPRLVQAVRAVSSPAILTHNPRGVEEGG